eukprot:5394242-Prorocentrum_lima.AAC.1
MTSSSSIAAGAADPMPDSSSTRSGTRFRSICCGGAGGGGGAKACGLNDISHTRGTWMCALAFTSLKS